MTLREIALCENCNKAPATDNWGGLNDSVSLARNPGLIKRWCRRCVLQAQIAHWTALVPLLAEAQRELAEFDAPGAQERMTEKEDSGAGLIHPVASPLAETEPRLDSVERVSVWSVDPEDEGGDHNANVGFSQGDRFANIEFFPDGDILVGMGGKHEQSNVLTAPNMVTAIRICREWLRVGSVPVMTAERADSTRRSAAQGSSSHSRPSLTEEM